MKKTCKRLFALLLAVIMVIGTIPMIAAADDPIVAKLTLFSYTKNCFDTGHSWLYFENLTDKNITVGVYTLEPGKAVSVGTFKNTRSDGAGVYYNVEAYCTAKYGSSGRVSLSETITASELAKVNGIINSNNTWSLVHNCAWFAAKVWNSVSDIDVFSGSTPSCLKTSMKVESGYKTKTNAPMFAPAANQVYKQKGSTLVVVSSGSLKNPL